MTEHGLQGITSSGLTQMPQCLLLGQFFGLENVLLKIFVKCNVSSGKGEGINHYLCGQSFELFSTEQETYLFVCEGFTCLVIYHGLTTCHALFE